jgi:hypothetical protein
MSDGCYLFPGECAKCESDDYRFDFAGEETMDLGDFQPKMIGYLWAICKNCGFKWTVTPKDEMDA